MSDNENECILKLRTFEPPRPPCFLTRHSLICDLRSQHFCICDFLSRRQPARSHAGFPFTNIHQLTRQLTSRHSLLPHRNPTTCHGHDLPRPPTHPHPSLALNHYCISTHFILLSARLSFVLSSHLFCLHDLLPSHLTFTP